ncbi:hypothetical protein HY635_04060 [Candidatus Uhrbacteria bacterium]|nr:hypothetical protein [Candidatus Uhrbacteria bacterium]
MQRIENPIPTALTLLGVVPKSGERPTERDLRMRLKRARAYRKETADMLLPIEKPAALRALDFQIAALEGGSLGFQRVPFDKLREVLGWRNPDGFPTLAPFSVESEEFAFASSPNAWPEETVTPALPAPIRGCYDDVFKKLRERRARRNVKVRASVTFTGVIPEDVRRTIASAQRAFKDIRVLAEVDRWQLEETELPALRTDPLVIGYDGQEFWLLAAFDITPLEDAVRQICLGKEPTAS